MSKKKQHSKNNQTIRNQGIHSISGQFYVKDYFSKKPGEITIVDLSGKQFDISKEQAKQLAKERMFLSSKYTDLIAEINSVNPIKTKPVEVLNKAMQTTHNKPPQEQKPQHNTSNGGVLGFAGIKETKYNSIASEVIKNEKSTPPKQKKKKLPQENKKPVGAKKTINEIEILGSDRAEVFYDSGEHFANPIKNIRNWISNNALDSDVWVLKLNTLHEEYMQRHVLEEEMNGATTTSPRKKTTASNNPIINHQKTNQQRTIEPPKRNGNNWGETLNIIMQEGIKAIQHSDYIKIRESFLLAYKTRKENGDTNPSSKVCKYLLKEASTALQADMHKASLLFDLCYEIKQIDRGGNFRINESFHIWDGIIVDWVKMIAVDSAQAVSDTIELPLGVIGISKGLERLLESTKKIIFPSSFRFVTLDDARSLRALTLREFLFEHCGNKPNISISGDNRFIKEQDGFLLSRSRNEPIMIANNNREDISFPEGWISASSNLFANPKAIKSISIPKSLSSLSGRNGSTQSFFEDLPNIKTVTIAPGNKVFSSSENVFCRGSEVVKIFKTGTNLVFPFIVNNCSIPIPDYWKGCECVQFSSQFILRELLRITNELQPKKIRVHLDTYRKLEKTVMPNDGNVLPEMIVFDSYGTIPPDQLSFFFRRRAMLPNGTVGPAIPLRINDIVSVMNTFQCVNKGHVILEVAGLLGYGDGSTRPKEKAIRCFYCCDCERYFMYSDDFKTQVYHLIASNRFCMFTKFRYNNVLYDSHLGLNANGFAQESLLKKAGYQVNQTVDLSAKERLSILMFLYDRGVSPHFILSYLNQFITLNGSSLSKNMTVAVHRWKEDMQEFKNQIYGNG